MQWEVSDKDEQSSAAGFTAYKSLHAKHMKDTYRSGDYMLATQLGIGALSKYRVSAVTTPVSKSFVTQASVLGKLEYFKIFDEKGISEATAVMTREPVEQFGHEQFEFSIYKLQRADEATQTKEMQKAIAAEPRHIHVSLPESKQRGVNASHPIKLPAQTDLPLVRVDIANSLPESSRYGAVHPRSSACVVIQCWACFSCRACRDVAAELQLAHIQSCIQTHKVDICKCAENVFS